MTGLLSKLVTEALCARGGRAASVLLTRRCSNYLSLSITICGFGMIWIQSQRTDVDEVHESVVIHDSGEHLVCDLQLLLMRY